MEKYVGDTYLRELFFESVRRGNLVHATRIIEDVGQGQGAEKLRNSLVNTLREGSSPLHVAICSNHYAMVAMLLQGCGDANLMDGSGFRPLHLSILAALSAVRARHKRKVDRQRVPLEEADLAILHLCLAAGADTELPRILANGDKTSTPLFEAVCDGEVEVARTLLKHGANCNIWGKARDCAWDESALHVATRKKRPCQEDLCKLLLHYGADPFAKALTGEITREGAVAIDPSSHASSPWIKSLVTGLQMARAMQKAEQMII